MYKFCFFNGKIHPANNPRIDLNDLGVIRGYGIFDYLRTYNGKPFLLDKYIARFQNSAKQMQLPLPYSELELAGIVNELLAKNKIAEAGIRFVITGGVSEDNYNIGKPVFYILIEDVHTYPDKWYKEGIKLMTHDHCRVFPEIKLTNYITAIRLQPVLRQKEMHDILYIYDNKVLETTRSNFFIFKNATLITPENNVLIGRTRNCILDLAKNDFKIEQRDIEKVELSEADEAFITSSSQKVMPVVKIDDILVGNGKVGANTRRVMELFDKFTNAY